jgi:antitoxin (DNA-binding transcriptional repressor) of toxin-antitoxin stability system
MTNIATNDLANQLPHLLQALAAGEEFLITEAGRPVARLLPPPFSADQALSGQAWQSEFAAWMERVESRAGSYPAGFVLDDSREAMYAERENAQR